ncbi:MAG: helix-turn-helix domain-containing protein [Pseudonocardiales bacterium]|nr:helix-turn-helix domain-containing protein [Pseudonocardiales bacterium]
MDGTRERSDHEAGRKVGAELRRFRIDRGWSQAELAKLVHYSVGYLSKMENGKKRITPEMAGSFDEVLATGGVLAALLPTSEDRTPVQGDLAPPATGPCPYPGLAAFGPDEARWFFGRAQITADLVHRLDERLGEGGPLAVVAPSGAGKSSLLAAGLIPALAGGALPGSRGWSVVTATPGAHPLDTLADRVAAETGADPAAAAAVAGDPDRFATFLTEVVNAGKPQETSSSAQIMLIIDQFEEIFTECREETQRQAFITALRAAAASPAVVVVLGVRADFYAQCLASRAVSAALEGHLPLEPMSADQLREVITRPAQVEGLGLEPGLVELLLRDLGGADNDDTGAAGYDPGALPLLAHALRVTWQQREGHTLTVAGYRRTGGIRRALASTAERAYTRLNQSEQQIAQQVLLRLINVREQGTDTRRRLPRTHLAQAGPMSADAVEAVLEVFSRARLVTLDTDSVEITHEALLSAWPRLATWISADRAGLRTHQQLSEAANAWEQAGRDPSELYRGTRLALTRDWVAGHGRKDRLSTLEDAFLGASIDQQHREQRAERRRTRRMRQLVAGLTALVVIIAVVLVIQKSTAHDRDLALSSVVADRANQVSKFDPTRGMQLSVAAYDIADTLEARSSLLSASTLYSATRVLTNIGPINAVAISGHTLATGSSDQTIRLYDISNPKEPTFLSSITDHTDAINALAFSPDGQTLASGGRDRTVRLWDVGRPDNPRPKAPRPRAFPLDTHIGHNQGVTAVAFSSSGSALAIGGADGAVQLWDLDPHHSPNVLPGRAAFVDAVAFSPPDRHMLVSGDDDDTVRLWDLNHPDNLPEILTDFAHPADPIYTIALSPDGHTLASGTRSGRVQLWDLTNPRKGTSPAFLPGRTDASIVKTAAFSPDGNTLAIGRADGTVQLWDLTNLHNVTSSDLSHVISSVTPLTLPATKGSVNAVAFTPDGHTLASGTDNGAVSLTDITTFRNPTSLTSIGLNFIINSVDAVAFSPDGHTLASGIDSSLDSDSGPVSHIGMVLLWDRSDPRNPRLTAKLPGGTGAVDAAVFSPDGHSLASGGADGMVRLWNLTNPHDPRLTAILPGGTDAVTAVAFSRDGHILASGDNDRMVRLWDLTTPAQPKPLGEPLTGNNSWVTAVAFSPDGHLLASGGADGMVRLWNLIDLHHVVSLPTLEKDVTYIRAMAFSPDGNTLVSGNNDGTLSLWDLTDPYHPHRAATPILTGHDQMIRAVTFSPDGNTLASGSDDNTVRLWDFTDHSHPQPWAVLTGHAGSVRAVAFDPSDGHTLASGSEDGAIRLWETDPDRVVKDICSAIVAPITDKEWKQDFHDMLHQPSCQ